jgi:hypothetical protein
VSFSWAIGWQVAGSTSIQGARKGSKTVASALAWTTH